MSNKKRQKSERNYLRTRRQHRDPHLYHLDRRPDLPRRHLHHRLPRGHLQALRPKNRTRILFLSQRIKTRKVSLGFNFSLELNFKFKLEILDNKILSAKNNNQKGWPMDVDFNLNQQGSNKKLTKKQLIQQQKQLNNKNNKNLKQRKLLLDANSGFVARKPLKSIFQLAKVF
jgi:hypothetical protein